MDKKQALKKAQQYANLIKDKLKPEKVILYGSYAKGTWDENSDIDIAIIVDKIDDLLTSEALLYKLRRGIDDWIEPVLFERNNNRSGFLDEILKHGQVIYNISDSIL